MVSKVWGVVIGSFRTAHSFTYINKSDEQKQRCRKDLVWCSRLLHKKLPLQILSRVKRRFYQSSLDGIYVEYAPQLLRDPPG